MDCSLPGSSVHGILQAKYWSGLPFPPPGDLPVEDLTLVYCGSCAAGGFFTTEPPGKPLLSLCTQHLTLDTGTTETNSRRLVQEHREAVRIDSVYVPIFKKDKMKLFGSRFWKQVVSVLPYSDSTKYYLWRFFSNTNSQALLSLTKLEPPRLEPWFLLDIHLSNIHRQSYSSWSQELDHVAVSTPPAG